MRGVVIVATTLIALQRAGAQGCYRSLSHEGCDVGVGALTPVSPPVGSRIRVVITHELDGAGHPMGVMSELVGTVRRLDHDTLVVVRRAVDTTLTVAYIVRMEVVGGKTTAAWPVAIGGSIAGGLLGFLAGSVSACGLSAVGGCHNTASHERQGFIAGGLAGAVVGFGIGSLFRVDRWVDVPVSVFRATLGPGHPGFAARFQATF